MKILNITLFIIIITTSLWAQSSKDIISIEDKRLNEFFHNMENIPIVKGRFLNVTERDIEKATIRYSFPSPIGNRQISKTCKLNNDGTFQLELDYAIPYQQIWISVGRLYHAYLHANKDLFIELDAQILKQNKGVDYYGAGIKYLSVDGELNTFLNKHKKFQNQKQIDLESQIHYFKNRTNLNVEDFVVKYDSIFNYLNIIDNEFIKQNPSEYSWIIKNERLSNYYSNLMVNFHNRDKQMSNGLYEKVRQHKPLVFTKSGMSFYNKLFNYQMKFSNISEYKIELDNLKTYSKLTCEQRLFLDTTVYERNIEVINSIFRDTIKVAQYVSLLQIIDTIYDTPKADFLKLNFIQSNPSENKFILEALLTNLETDWCRNVVKMEYQQNQFKLNEANTLLEDSEEKENVDEIGEFLTETPSGAKLYVGNNKGTGTLLKGIKNKFPNKALVIDFWATWCGPCISQLPYSQKLHKETEVLPVEFIYICTSQNSTKQDWVSKITDLNLSGTHLFLDKEKIKSFMKAFSINGFPSYVFIDSNGDYKPGVISSIRDINKNKLIELTNE